MYNFIQLRKIFVVKDWWWLSIIYNYSTKYKTA